jgi:ABC-type branched-subunit amino acid transport system substrate-binding protein
VTGVISAITGPGQYTEQAALKAANAAGGVNGYTFKWKIYDTASTPTGGLNAARLAVADHVFATLTSWALPDAGLPTLSAANIPTIGDGDGPKWSGPTNLFSVIGNVITQNTTAWMDVLIQQGKTRLAIPGGTINPTVATDWADKLIPLAGGTTCYKRVGIDGTNSATITAVAHQIIAAHCQGVISPTLYPGTLALQAALNQLGASIPIVDAGDFGQAVVKQFGATANGLISANQYATPYDTDDPGIVQYLKDMKTYEPGVDPYCGNCIKGYIAAKWFLKALGDIKGPVTQQSLIDQLNTTKNYTVDGLVGPITEPDYHTVGDLCLSYSVIENGQWKALYGGAFPFKCGKRYTAATKA